MIQSNKLKNLNNRNSVKRRKIEKSENNIDPRNIVIVQNQEAWREIIKKEESIDPADTIEADLTKGIINKDDIPEEKDKIIEIMKMRGDRLEGMMTNESKDIINQTRNQIESESPSKMKVELI